MSQVSLDDLQSMFPQLPVTAIQDIVEQAGGSDNAVEALLNMTDTQHAVVPLRTTLPLVTTQLVNTAAVKQRALHFNDTGHSSPRLPPGPWYAQHMHVKPSGRQKSPYRSPRKKERHTAHNALGILGMLSNLHDSKPSVNVKSATQVAAQNGTPVKPQVLLPWQQAGSQHAYQPSTPDQNVERVASACHSIVPVNNGSRGPSPLGLTGSPQPPKQRSPIPALQISVPVASAPAAPVSPHPFSWLNPGVPSPDSVAAPSASDAGMKTPDAVSPSMVAASPTLTGAAFWTSEQSTLPDVEHKVAFLVGMFEDLQLPHDSVKKVLEASNGSVETAVNKLLEYQAMLDTAVHSSPSEDNSSNGSGDDDETPEEKRERALRCLKALHSHFSDRELEYVLEMVDNNVDMAVEVLTDMEKKEQLDQDEQLARQLAEQQQQQQPAVSTLSQDEQLAHELAEQQRRVAEALSQDEELARKLQEEANNVSNDEQLARQLQLEDQRQAAAVSSKLPVPIHVPVPVPSELVPRHASPPPPPPPTQQRAARTVSWEEHTERTMLSCRIKLLQHKFACRVEPDIAEAALARCDQDVVRATELLVQSGLPLKAEKDAAGPRPKSPTPEQQQLLQISDEELLRLRQEEPERARHLIHERTQAMYDQYRRRAQEYMALKRDAIERSSYYFSIGDRERCEALKAEARRYGELAYQENQKAGNNLYKHRNNTLMNKWEVDLHALHINEAIQKLDSTINTLAALPSNKVIKAITGRGAHSRDEPKLYLAVKDHLLARGLSFEGHLGFFMIYLGDDSTPAAPTSISNPPTPSRPSPPPNRRCRTQDDDELRRLTRAPEPPTLMDFVRHR